MPWFTVHERQLWDEVTAELRDMGTLTSADRYTIASYVTVLGHVERAAVALGAEKSYVTMTRYSEMVNPMAKALDMFLRRAEALARQLGLTPAARSAIHGRQPERADTEADHVEDLYA